jgi:hypothetical protein
MARYEAAGQTAAGTNLTVLKLVASTTRRGFLYDIVVGSDATPADVATEFQIIRGTVSGTGTGSPTIKALDPASGAATLSTKVGTFSGQTKTADSNLLMIALNQRATFRWVAAPGGELVIPSTSDNWVGLESIASGGTPNINAQFHYDE